jgi:hypothetical protein
MGIGEKMKFQTQEVIDRADLGFKNIPIRFFIYDEHGEEGELELFECNEEAFLEAEGVIEYERHTTFLNGCNQICLTKNPYGA